MPKPKEGNAGETQARESTTSMAKAVYADKYGAKKEFNAGETQARESATSMAKTVYADKYGAKQEFFSTDNGTKAGVSAPIVIQRYSWLIDVLACWLSTNYGSSAIIERVRS